MPAPYLGGLAITSARWISTHALRVAFSSTYAATYLYQLYHGRELIGVTDTPLERQIVGQLIPQAWPEPLALLAVTPANKLTDYGASLPPRPYNRVKLTVTPAGWAGVKQIEVAAGTAVGGAVDVDNVIARTLYDTNRAYQIVTEPLEGTGVWNLEVAGRDDRPPAGNRGTAQAVAVTVTSHPPDLTFIDSAGRRFTPSIAAGVLTVTYTLPV
jgi:hypothetical protein